MKKTEIICITDRSGSMSSIKSDVEGGFNAFIDEQRKLPGEARVTMVEFDDTVSTAYQARQLQEVPAMTLRPRGSTALLDAIGTTLNTQGARIAGEKWADLVIVVIITDGQENASREFSGQRIKEMIGHAESTGWKFIFLAANQDAFAAGDALGINATHTRGFQASAAGVKSAYAHTTQSVTSLRSAP